MRVVAATLLLWALLVVGIAAAQIDVDAEGGPLVLSEEVARAFEIWQESFAAETLAEPTARVAFARDLLGPDTLSLTLRYDDGRTEVLLDPTRYATGPVLVHEMGLLLGVAAGGDGVMDPSIGVDDPATPTAADVAMLRDLSAFPAADITRDGVVDFYDLAELGASFGSVGINLKADLNGDSRVDEEDLAILREAYAFTDPAPAPAPATTTQTGPAAPAVGMDGEPDGPAEEAPDDATSEPEEAPDDATSEPEEIEPEEGDPGDGDLDDAGGE